MRWRDRVAAATARGAALGAQAARFVVGRVERAPRPAVVAQVAHVAGDAAVAVALANTLFFELPLGEARLRIGLYLLLAFAPYAVVAPLVTRLLAGRVSYRLTIALSDAGRVVLAVALIPALDSPLLYPVGFAFLVLSRAHSVARNALLPDLGCPPQQLVAANAGISIASGLAGAAGGALGVAATFVAGSTGALLTGAAVLAAGAAYAVVVIPAEPVRQDLEEDDPAGAPDRTLADRCSPALAGLAGVQATFAFTIFVYAFTFHRELAILPLLFGIVTVAGLVATLVAPRLGERLSDLSVVRASLVLVAAAALLIPELGSLAGALALTAAVGFSSRLARVAFDAVVQRRVARADRGVRFARYEVVAQLAWIAGAAVPSFVVVNPSLSRYPLVGTAATALAVSLVVAVVRS